MAVSLFPLENTTMQPSPLRPLFAKSSIISFMVGDGEPPPQEQLIISAPLLRACRKPLIIFSSVQSLEKMILIGIIFEL